MVDLCSTLCTKHGHQIDFLDAPAKQMGKAKALNIISKSKGNNCLFVIETSTPSIKSDVNFGSAIKKIFPQSFIVLVGTHPSACPEETLGYSPDIDAIAIGEFDVIITELANQLETDGNISEVRGLCYRKEDKIVRTPPMPTLTDLDELPYASSFIKEYLDVRDYFIAASSYPSIQILQVEVVHSIVISVYTLRLCRGMYSGHVLPPM